METRPRIRRRAVLTAGSAWAVPTLVVASPARAAATSASCSTPCPSLDFGTSINSNGWRVASQGSFDESPVVEYVGTYTPWTGSEARCTGATGGTTGGTLNSAVLVKANPTSLATAPNITYQADVCVTSGYSYEFAFDWSYYGINRRATTLVATLERLSGGAIDTAEAVVAPWPTRGNPSANAKGTRTLRYKPTISENLKFVYTWTFAATPSTTGTSSLSCDRQANDIAVTAPRMTCAKL